MTEPGVDRLLERLERLEQELAELKAQRTSRVTAPFEVVNKSGTVLLRIDEDADGGCLHLLSPAGTPAVSLEVDSDAGGAISINNRSDERIISLFGDDEGGNLGLYDQTGAQAALFDVQGGGGCLIIGHPGGKMALSLWISEVGGELVLYDAEERPVAELRATAVGGHLGITTSAGEVVSVIRAPE